MGTNEKILYEELSYRIVGLAMEVHSKLGYGFLEKVYENALTILLRREGIQTKQQSPIKVYFEGEVVGEYFADILVEDKIILELKVLDKITDVQKAQALNYLKGNRLEVSHYPKLWEKQTRIRKTYQIVFFHSCPFVFIRG